MRSLESIGLNIPDILLPKAGIDLRKWAVIACDQFTSQPEYWQNVAGIVGDAPSSFKLILPEVWLHSEDIAERVATIHQNMRAYLNENLFETSHGMVLAERSRGGKTQTGLVLALDLEAYDYSAGSLTLIRATEGTILDRLPPRMQVRRGAALELPHILVLYDDPSFSVLETVLEQKEQLPLLYDFELMLGSGHLSGRLIAEPDLWQSIADALSKLITPDTYAQKYKLPSGSAPLLFAMGDGNHSLATAKAVWEEMKPTVGMNHPARYALVEIVNLHDPSLNFEAIHRVLFNVPATFQAEFRDALTQEVSITKCEGFADLRASISGCRPDEQCFGMLSEDGYQHVALLQPSHNLAVGSLQSFLDAYLSQHPEARIDYVHGDDTLDALSRQANNVGFYLPPISKNSFFRSILVDGALPRKTFSMGHAEDKRFYMESRCIA